MNKIKVFAFLALTFAFGFAGATLGAVVMAQGNGTIHACIHKSNGNVRIVGANETCKNNETSLTWGSGGGSSVQIAIREGVPTFSQDEEGNIYETGRIAYCLPGEKVVGGGFIQPSSFSFNSYPSTALTNGDGDSVEGWVISSSGASASYAICLSQ